MAKQICEHFAQDIVNQVPVKDQIQKYMDEHPTYRVSTCSYATTGISREAMVIFYDPSSETGSQKPKQK